MFDVFWFRRRILPLIIALSASLPACQLAEVGENELSERLAAVQSRLLDLGADLATPPDSRAGGHVGRAEASWADGLEAEIDAMEAELPPLTTFLLPGGTPGAAHLHHARTVCRRAERSVVALARSSKVEPLTIVYLNRLSDLLFVLARYENHVLGRRERTW